MHDNLKRHLTPSQRQDYLDDFGQTHVPSFLFGVLLLTLVCVALAHRSVLLLLRSGHRSEEQLAWGRQEPPRPPRRQ